jgi:regulator of sigma E protease
MENRPAYEAGIETGDVILSINEDIEIINWPQFSNVIREHRNEEISLSILRNGDTLDKSLTVDSLGIGIMRNMNADFPTQKYGFGQAIYYGWSDAMEMLRLNITGLGKIFKGQEKATDSLQGPIGIAQIYGGVWDWHKFWYITGLLSLILAFMNILPIPALDGGHVIFLLIEIITRRKLSDKLMGNIQMIGMLILFALMFFVIGNDIFRLFK